MQTETNNGRVLINFGGSLDEQFWMTESTSLKPFKPLLVTSYRALCRKDSLCTLCTRFCMSRKGGTGGGGWDHPQGDIHMVAAT